MAAVLLAGARWALRPTRLVVTGRSMEPTLLPGDRVLAVRWPSLRPGAIVAVADPRLPRRLVVKRIAAVEGCRVTVVGDNPRASTDSRDFGPVDRSLLRGRVVYRYGPSDRVGVVRRGTPT